MDAFARFAQPWLDRAARIGADPRDDEDLRLRKALLVLVSVLILPISLVWGAIYLAFGVTAGLIAWLYLLISVAAIAIFSRTRDTDWLLRVELLDILLAPTISMAFVGGFLPSGAVGLWGILAPLGALVFDGARAGCAGSSPSSRCSSSPGSWASSPAAAEPSRRGSRAR